MAQIDCTIEIDSDSKKIFIKDLHTSPIEIDFSTDIDLTNLVSILCDLIEQDKSINIIPPIPDQDDVKLNLIINTIKEIFNSFNKILQTEEENSEENIPEGLPF